MNKTFQTAIDAYENQKFDTAYSLFKEVSQEEPRAMLNLAMMHLKGKGCEQSNSNAKMWLERAAKKDSAQAHFSLAVMYEKGVDGISIDTEQALEHYTKAANLGHIEAQLKAGMLLRQKGEILQSMRYFITAAHNNNEHAQEIITYVSNRSMADRKNEPFHILSVAQQKKLIEDMIDEKIRPTLEFDNGGISFVNYVPGKTPQIWLNYLGACSGCHLGSTSTADMLLDHFETLIDKDIILYLM